jgi:hypothetical protein
MELDRGIQMQWLYRQDFVCMSRLRIRDALREGEAGIKKPKARGRI